MRIVLVCGSRDQGVVSYGLVASVLPKHFTPGDRNVLVVHGGAAATDSYVDHWCRAHGIHTAEVAALWEYYREQGNVRSAGPIRNDVMAALRPTECLAFPGGRGTADMVRKMEALGIPITRVAA